MNILTLKIPKQGTHIDRLILALESSRDDFKYDSKIKRAFIRNERAMLRRWAKECQDLLNQIHKQGYRL